MAVAVAVGDATAGCRVRAPRLPPQAASLGHTWLLLPGRWGCCRGQWGTRGRGQKSDLRNRGRELGAKGVGGARAGLGPSVGARGRSAACFRLSPAAPAAPAG